MRAQCAVSSSTRRRWTAHGARIDGDDKAALVQPADRLARAREQFYPIGLVKISGVVDNRAVAVEKGRALTHEGLRLRYPPVRERLCAHRATRGCPRPAR